MTPDDGELRAQAKRRSRIREALATGAPVVLRLHPHLHAPGYAVFAEYGDSRIYACTLAPEHLSAVFDADLVVMEAGSPEDTVRAWLSREFPGNCLKNVRVERCEA